MNVCYVEPGNDPDYGKLGRYHFSGLLFDIREPRLTPAYLDGVKAHGYEPRLFSAWDWPEVESLSGGGFAEWTDAQLRAIGWKGNAAVCLDVETHDVSYLVSCLQRWRQLRPKRLTDWTLEPHQGGLFGSSAVAAINAAHVGVVPQLYLGDAMEPVDGMAATLDLVLRGFDPSRLFGFYDGAAPLPAWWRGYVDGMGRLT